MLGALAAVIYAFNGTLDVFPSYSDQRYWWQEKTVWYPLACVVVLSGLALVSIWNANYEPRAFKWEEWEVTSNSTRSSSLLYFVTNRRGRVETTRVLKLSRNGTVIAHAYESYLEPKLAHIPVGAKIQVRLRMGLIGLFQFDGLEQ